MNDHIAQPEFVVISREYEAQLIESYKCEAQAMQMRAKRQLATLQESHAQELSRKEMALVNAREKLGQVKQENIAWRQKIVLYKMRLASAQETIQLMQTHLKAAQIATASLTDEREILLEQNHALILRAEKLTTICQAQHRTKLHEQAAQQGALASTSAEAEGLQRQLTEMQALNDQLQLQLVDERATLTSARTQLAETALELDEQRKELQQQRSDAVALRAEVERLRESLQEEREEHVMARTRVEKLTKEVAVHLSEREAAEQRLTRHLQNAVQRDEVLVHQMKAADAVVIQQLRQSLEQLQEQLQKERRSAEDEQRRLRGRLEQESGLRASVEEECAQHRQQLREEQSSHAASQTKLRNELSEREVELEVLRGKVAALEKLRRQLGEKEADLELLQDKVANMEKLRRQVRDQEAQLELMQDKVTVAEKKAEVRATQLLELEAALERSKLNLGQQVVSKDAAVAALTEQLDQQRRTLEQKESLLRDAEAAHQRQVAHLQKRLEDCEAAAREQEVQLRQQLDAVRLKASQAGSSEAQAQQRATELEGLLRARDERVRQLEEGRTADAAQQEERHRQLRRSHDAEVAGLRAKIQQLEQQLAVMPSPAEPPRHQVRCAAAALDKLMGNLVGGSPSPAAGAFRAIDEEEERGPSAAQILNLSSQADLLHTSGRELSQKEPNPDTAAAPGDRATEAGAGAGGAGASGDAAGRGGEAEAAGRGGSGKRPLEQPSEAEKPAGTRGRRRGTKAAAAEKPPAAEEADEDDDTLGEAPSKQQLQTDRADRRVTRSRATGQAAQGAAAAPAAAADDSEPESETPSYSLRSSKAAAKQRGKQTAAAGAAAAAGKDADSGAGSQAGKARRGRATKNAAQAQAQQQPEHEEQPESGPGPSQAEAGDGAPRPGPGTRADMPPPPQRPAGKRPRGVVDSSQDGNEGAPGLDEEVATQNPSQPATQPEPRADPLSRAGLVCGGGNGGGASAYVPASSQLSMYSSQGLKPYEPLMAKNPLAAINQRVIEQAKHRVRLVPYAALQQLKPMSKTVPPSLAKGQPQLPGGAAKRPLEPSETGGDTAAGAGHSHQPPPNKAGRH